jgi:hypothetical protein
MSFILFNILKWFKVEVKLPKEEQGKYTAHCQNVNTHWSFETEIR